MLKLTTKLMNRFSYYITTHFITSNKYKIPVVIPIQCTNFTLRKSMIALEKQRQNKSNHNLGKDDN